MNVRLRVPASRQTLTAALEGLTALDAVFLQRGNFPRLYKSGVRYQREPPGIENWLTVPEVLRVGLGDCEDLACWLCAERRVRDRVACRVVAKRTGRKKFHALVQYADGSYEDPSRVLGMGRR